MAGRTLTVGRLVLILSVMWALVPLTAVGQTVQVGDFFDVKFVDSVSKVWTDADRAAVIRGFEYWAERLEGNTPGRRVTIEVFWDVGGAGDSNNAYSLNELTPSARKTADGQDLQATLAERVIAEGGTEPLPATGRDGVICFQPNSFTTFPNAPNGPIPQSNLSLESITIHELGHTLGYLSATSTSGPQFSTPLTVFDSWRLDSDGRPATAGGAYDSNGYFIGPHASAVYGDTLVGSVDSRPVPIYGQGSHLAVDRLLMTHLPYRNYPFFTELELAVLQDLGYAIDRRRFFGQSYYTDGGGLVTNGVDWESDAMYAVGLHVHADLRNIRQSGDITTSGAGATGIRIDGDDNVVTLAPGTTIHVMGPRSAGILVSNGMGNTIIHQGSIITDTRDSPGILIDFGTNLLDDADRWSSDRVLGSYLVTSLNVNGEISAADGRGSAIEIGSTAGLKRINIMQGAVIDGDIWCDALTDLKLKAAYNVEVGLEVPVITFGLLADGFGRATNDVDPDFHTRVNGNIRGSTLMAARLAGGTTVFHGEARFESLTIDPQAVLAGNGRIRLMTNEWLMQNQQVNLSEFPRPTVENHGAISPGDGDNNIGALRIEANLHNHPSSSIRVDMAPANGDLLVVRGTAEIDGGTVYVNAAPGDYAIGDSHTFLRTDGGLNLTAMPLFSDNLAVLRALPRYNGDEFWFLLGRDVPFADMGQTANQIGWGEYFDNAKYSPVAEIQQLRDTLDLMPDEDRVRAAMDQMTGEIHGTLSILGVQSTTQFFRALATKMRSGPCQPFPITDQDMAGTGINRIRDGWTIGYGLGGNGDADGNAHAIQYSNGGTILGLTGLTQSGAECGVFYGYEMSHAKVADVHSAFNGDTHRFGGYLNGCGENTYHLLAAILGFTTYDVQRYVVFDDYYATPNADHGGFQAALYCEKGWLLEGRYLTVQPYAGLQYVYLGQDPFTETDGDVFNLTVDSIGLHSLRSVVGSRLGSQPITSCLRATFDTVWWHEFLNPTTAQYTAAFAVADQWRFTASGLDLGQDWFTVGPGLEWRVGTCSLFGKYELMFNQHQSFHTGAGGVEWTW